MSQEIQDFIEPFLSRVEGWVQAIAADVPLETNWAQSSFGSW
jgi:hypothetical protein